MLTITSDKLKTINKIVNKIDGLQEAIQILRGGATTTIGLITVLIPNNVMVTEMNKQIVELQQSLVDEGLFYQYMIRK